MKLTFVILAAVFAAVSAPLMLCLKPTRKIAVFATVTSSLTIFFALVASSGAPLTVIAALLAVIFGAALGGIYVFFVLEVSKLRTSCPEALKIFYPPMPEIFIPKDELRKMEEAMNTKEGIKAAKQLLNLSERYRLGKRLEIAKKKVLEDTCEGNCTGGSGSGQEESGVLPTERKAS